MKIVNPMTATEIGKASQSSLILFQSTKDGAFDAVGVFLEMGGNNHARVLVLRSDPPALPYIDEPSADQLCLAIETDWVIELVPFPCVPTPAGTVGSITVYDGVPYLHIKDGTKVSNFANTPLINLLKPAAGDLSGYTTNAPVPGWRVWMRAEDIGSANAKPLVDSSDLPRPEK